MLTERLIGECYKRNLNLNSWLVSNGYAVAYRKYSKKYISNEINAKNEKKGLGKVNLKCHGTLEEKNKFIILKHNLQSKNKDVQQMIF